MIIRHATAHKWLKDITGDPLSAFGKNSKARIKSTLNKIDDLPIRTEIRELDEEFLHWFLPMYELRINEKENPVVFDIRGKTIGKENQKKQYYSLSLYENDEAIGGSIFSTPKDRLSIAYRTYNNRWNDVQLQANPSLYTEYVICKHAFEIGKEVLIHGKDRNPYGIYSNIGLAAFKLSVGCQPVKSLKYELSEIDITSIETDALVLEYPEHEEKITKAHLVVSKETEQKYAQVTKYPERLEVFTHYRD